jgi:hypothetical protein
MVFMYINTVSRKLRQSSACILLLIILSSAAAFAQKIREEAPPLKERLFYGGSFGLQFGTITDIEVSPVVGIWVLPRLAVAAGPNYRYYKDPFGRTDIYGGRLYTEFVFIQDLNSIIPLGLNFGFFLHAEDELLSLESEFWKDPPFSGNRFFVNTGLAGIGMRQPMGRRSSMNLMVLWALNQPVYNLYGTPEVRISFIF